MKLVDCVVLVARGERVNVEVGISLCCLQAAVTRLETPALFVHLVLERLVHTPQYTSSHHCEHLCCDLSTVETGIQSPVLHGLFNSIFIPSKNATVCSNLRFLP